MGIEHKAPVQNGAKEIWSKINPNLVVVHEEGKLPSAVVGPG